MGEEMKEKWQRRDIGKGTCDAVRNVYEDCSAGKDKREPVQVQGQRKRPPLMIWIW